MVEINGKDVDLSQDERKALGKLQEKGVMWTDTGKTTGENVRILSAAIIGTEEDVKAIIDVINKAGFSKKVSGGADKLLIPEDVLSKLEVVVPEDLPVLSDTSVAEEVLDKAHDLNSPAVRTLLEKQESEASSKPISKVEALKKEKNPLMEAREEIKSKLGKTGNTTIDRTLASLQAARIAEEISPEGEKKYRIDLDIMTPEQK